MDYPPRGTTLVRCAIARGLHRDPQSVVEFAKSRWGSGSDEVRLLQKANVGGGEVGSLFTPAPGVEFLDSVAFSSIFDKAPNFRKVPPYVSVLTNGAAAVGFWVGESKAIPLSPMLLDKSSLAPMKVGALAVVSKDLVMAGGPDAERTITNDLTSATARITNWSFLATGNGGSASSPASITQSAIIVPSSGNLDDDLEAAVAAHQGDFASSFWTMTPQLATRIGLRIGTRGELGPNGGSLLGLPVYAADISDSDGDSFSLVDASRVMTVDDGVSIAMSTDGTIEMSDTPTGASDTPVAMSAVPISLFDTDTVAFRVLRRINWAAAPGAIVTVVGASYTAP